MKRVTSRNGRAVSLAEIPDLTLDDFRDEILKSNAHGERTALFFSDKENDDIRMYAIVADDGNARLHYLSSLVPKTKKVESLTNEIPSLHIFEREITEETGVIFENHPWNKPVRYLSNNINSQKAMREYPFFSMEGDEIHEVAVGPVHAGVIEPGHFRFMCDGENVHHLEIQLGYQHRGVEALMCNGNLVSKATLAESIAGDSAAAHTSAYAAVCESLAGSEPSRRSHAVRGIACELERIGIHLGDLSEISNDIGYLSGNALFGALRTYIINTTQTICGNRFGRGLIRPGGVLFDIDEDLADSIRKIVRKIALSTEVSANALFSDPGVLSRLEKTGTVSGSLAASIGLTGPPARAAGLRRDVRADHPYGIYRYFPVYARVMDTGDVFARAYMRYIEIQQSCDLVLEILDSLPLDTAGIQKVESLAKESLTVSMVEGWRGEIVHCAITDNNGKIKRYKIKDPSLHNWTGLALALRGNGVSDFPLCNKSFNLSYCGFDL